MRTFIRLGIIMGLAILIAGCNANAKTAVESFKDPDFQNLTLNRVLITTKDMELFKDRKIARAFVSKFAQYTKTEALPAADLFFPTRNYTDEEKKELLEKNQITEIIEISQTDFRDVKEYIPGDAFIAGGFHHFGHVVIHRGYYASKPLATFKIKITTPDNKDIWLASAKTAGTVAADEDDLIDSLSDEIVKQLAIDGLVEVKKQDK